MNNKKGVELSMNLIIIAAIALLVLIIISILVLKGGSNVNQGTGCEAKGGSCSTGDTCADPAKPVFLPGGGCKTGERCCIPNPVGG
jgi:hypothetical protein